MRHSSGLPPGRPLRVLFLSPFSKRGIEGIGSEGSFREDLFYRIAVISLFLPPLRERREDILALSSHFLGKHRKIGEEVNPVLDHAAQEALLSYSWPGNIRELENCMEHALAMRRGPVITKEDLPVQILSEQPAYRSEDVATTSRQEAGSQIRALSAAQRRFPGEEKGTSVRGQGGAEPARQSDPSLQEPVRQLGRLPQLSAAFLEAEKAAIREAMVRHHGNRSHVARELGISRTTLWRKLGTHKLS